MKRLGEKKGTQLEKGQIKKRECIVYAEPGLLKKMPYP